MKVTQCLWIAFKLYSNKRPHGYSPKSLIVIVVVLLENYFKEKLDEGEKVSFRHSLLHRNERFRDKEKVVEKKNVQNLYYLYKFGKLFLNNQINPIIFWITCPISMDFQSAKQFVKIGRAFVIENCCKNILMNYN